MQAFILAGGFATRLWPLTEKRAKPLLPLALKPLLTWLVEKVPEGMPITVSTNAVFAKDFEVWKSEIRPVRRSSKSEGGSTKSETNSKHEIQILIEDAGHEDEKLGALGAVAKWIKEERVNDDVLLLAGDNYFDFRLEKFIGVLRGNPSFVAIDIKDREQAKQFGVVVTEKMQDPKPVKASVWLAKGFEEKPINPKSTRVSTGVIVFPKDTIPKLIEFAKEHPDNIGGILGHFIHKMGMTVDCIIFPENKWFDIGSFEAYLAATKALVGEKVLKVENAELSNGTTCTGSVVLGKGSKVCKSQLRNVVLFEDCEIEDCVLENCIIDNRCVLRGVDLTGKMLRAGTTLVRAQIHTSLLPRGEG